MLDASVRSVWLRVDYLHHFSSCAPSRGLFHTENNHIAHFWKFVSEMRRHADNMAANQELRVSQVLKNRPVFGSSHRDHCFSCVMTIPCGHTLQNCKSHSRSLVRTSSIFFLRVTFMRKARPLKRQWLKWMVVDKGSARAFWNTSLRKLGIP